MDPTQEPAAGGSTDGTQEPGAADRGQWKSRLGFVLAASGSAIGLGNIVVFGANAYKFGGGAFYLPYLLALLLVGIPVMILEFTIGHQSRKAFPQTLGMMAGKAGEFVGWWALLNALIITMYYVTLLGWVLGMLVASCGSLWEASLPTPNYAPESLSNPLASFFNLLASPTAMIFVAAANPALPKFSESEPHMSYGALVKLVERRPTLPSPMARSGRRTLIRES